MSMERRLVLFLVFSVMIMWGMPLLMENLGLMPKRPARPPVAAAKKDAAEAKPGEAVDALAVGADTDPATADAAKGDEKTATEGGEIKAATLPADAANKPAVAVVKPAAEVAAAEMVLGSSASDSPYHLEARFQQRGAGLESLRSSRIEAEIKEGRERGRPLTFIGSDTVAPPSFALSLTRAREEDEAADGVGEGEGDEPALMTQRRMKVPLDEVDWEVVRDEDGRAVRPVKKTLKATSQAIEGQEIVFEAELEGLGITVTKRFRLWQGEDGLELDLMMEGVEGAEAVYYELLGPHGLPIEGEWYTSTFRDVFFGGYTASGDQVTTKSAYDIVKYREEPDRYTSLPLKYAGVETNYFAVFLEPLPTPETLEKSWISEAQGVVIHTDPREQQKADVSVLLKSKPLEPAPNRPIRHSYRIFAGAKTAEALAAYDAFELSTYRKGWKLPVLGDMGAQFMSKYFIAPMLSRTYKATAWVSGLFGGKAGNYGIAIILLTVLVRLILFPLGRKQAKAAKKMQDLQPLMVELKTKYGEDKEQLTRETFALYKKHGVNPMGGCLPAIVQLPVLIGLWQALNNSVALRHSRFLWIDNLAAPDMLFKFPVELPLIGQWLGPYFNLLPILVVGLMLVQTKLFSPPATTPEQESQQKMMKFMMIFMAFLFYKVPAGLGIYFITSSMWQIGERLLLPKSAPILPGSDAATVVEKSSSRTSTLSKAAIDGVKGAAGSAAKKAGGGTGGGWWSEVRVRAQEKIEKIMDDASKDRTVRNAPAGDRDLSRDRDRPRNDGRNKPKNRPGKP